VLLVRVCSDSGLGLGLGLYIQGEVNF
jgi:hypothetical protein